MSVLAQGQRLARAQLDRLGKGALHAALSNGPDLLRGYIPLLSTFTQEDRDAKGLRTFSAGQDSQPPVYLAALELARDYPLLLLQGPPGSGKSVFGRHLALCASGQLLSDAHYNARRLQHDALHWDEVPLALYRQGIDLSCLLETDGRPADDLAIVHWLEDGQPLLLIIDDAQDLDPHALFTQAIELSERYPLLRILLLGDSDLCGDWHLPGIWQRHALLPLLARQRQAWLNHHPHLGERGLAEWAGHPAAFGLALGLPTATSEYDLARRWRQAYSGLRHDQRYLNQLLQAADLAHQTPADIARWLAEQAHQAQRPVGLYAHQLSDQGALFEALLAHADAPACVLLAAQLAGRDPQLAQHAAIKPALLALMTQAHYPLRQRIKAGKALAQLGDPRDLLALCAVPAGELVMGTAAYPNSAPVHRVPMAAFKIGRYPVSNGIYRQFVEATGHFWRSVEGRLPEQSNAPAVDLTWHDARAFCVWLTRQWQVQGRIRPDQHVRLPSEPEWEYAARGLQAQDELCYPWQGPWQPDRSNGEEASVNDTCPVGLFPLGRSPWGCDDMCGQVWEWTSTLWGEDMSQPHWVYPYADDGRENPDAPDRVRRVLRGGCFSSPAWKACSSYRGSLEANGFWRGNGFRVVVG